METMTFWVEYHGGFKGFNPNEFFEWEDSHPLCSRYGASLGGSLSRLHIPAFIPVFGVPESRAGFLFRPDSGGIRP